MSTKHPRRLKYLDYRGTERVAVYAGRGMYRIDTQDGSILVHHLDLIDTEGGAAMS